MRHENEKKRDRRVLEIEHGSLMPLVFGSNGARDVARTFKGGELFEY